MEILKIVLLVLLVLHLMVSLRIRLIYKMDYETLVSSFAWAILPEVGTEGLDKASSIDKALDKTLIMMIFIPFSSAVMWRWYQEYKEAKEESTIAKLLQRWVEDDLEQYEEVRTKPLYLKWEKAETILS